MSCIAEQVLHDRLGVRGFRRGVGTHNAVDAAPLDEAGLAAYFAGLDGQRLRGCWVACVVDVVSRHKHEGADFDIGNLARSLVVVAERLHNVRFEEVVVSEAPSTIGKARPLDAAGNVEVQINTTEAAPPPKKGAVKNAALVALAERLAKAPVGAWLVVPADLGKHRNVAFGISGLHRRGLCKCVVAYRDGAGRSILKKEK